MNKKIALLTGSNSQLGNIFNNILKKNSYFVIGTDIQNNNISKTNYYKQLDLSKTKNLNSFFNEIKKKFKNLNVLVNNAGAQTFNEFEKRNNDELEEVINVNLKANILITQFVFKNYFKKNKSGKIINLGSIYGVVSGNMEIYDKGDRKTSEIYGATKAGVIHLTKYYSTYMSKYNIQVNCISPGGVLNKKKQKKKFIKKYISKTPMNKMADDRKDIGKSFEMILIHSPDYLNGQNIIVDGGYTTI